MIYLMKNQEEKLILQMIQNMIYDKTEKLMQINAFYEEYRISKSIFLSLNRLR
jgi:hypothetical protein